MKAHLIKWVGPSAVALVVMTFYLLFVAPEIQRARAMWNFLGASFDAAIQAQQRAMQQGQKPEGPK